MNELFPPHFKENIDAIKEERACFHRKTSTWLWTQRRSSKHFLASSCDKAALTCKTASLSRRVTLILCDLIQITRPVHQLAPMRSLTALPHPYCLL